MNLKTKKELAAHVLKVSPKRVFLNPERLDEIKDALTRADVKALVKDKAIIKKQKKSKSSSRSKKIKAQKSKGKRKGQGSRRGRKTARSKKKETWMNKVRLQRKYIRELKDKGLLDNKQFRMLYLKIKSGFFRSKSHLKIYLQDMGILKREAKKNE